MRGYYDGNLDGERLRRCYDIAPARVRQYLEAEIAYVREKLNKDDVVLELGCGYGRVAFRLADKAARVIGIDTSTANIAFARESTGGASKCQFFEMDALELAFVDSVFDKVVCIQNGICAFGVDREALIQEALRVTQPLGEVIFSTYSEKFWDDRLAWFEAQSGAGLVGSIDYQRTKNGTVVCEDGFSSGTMSHDDFRRIAKRLGVGAVLTEVDESSVFCQIKRGPNGAR